jgi:hypothetical protein
MASFSPNFNSKIKINQKFKNSQPKIINHHLIGDFFLAYLIFFTDFNLKLDEKLGKTTLQEIENFSSGIQTCFLRNCGEPRVQKNNSIVLVQPLATQIGSRANFLLKCQVEGQYRHFFYIFSRFFYEMCIFQRL